MDGWEQGRFVWNTAHDGTHELIFSSSSASKLFAEQRAIVRKRKEKKEAVFNSLLYPTQPCCYMKAASGLSMHS